MDRLNNLQRPKSSATIKYTHSLQTRDKISIPGGQDISERSMKSQILPTIRPSSSTSSSLIRKPSASLFAKPSLKSQQPSETSSKSATTQVPLSQSQSMAPPTQIQTKPRPVASFNPLKRTAKRPSPPQPVRSRSQIFHKSASTISYKSPPLVPVSRGQKKESQGTPTPVAMGHLAARRIVQPDNINSPLRARRVVSTTTLASSMSNDGLGRRGDDRAIPAASRFGSLRLKPSFQEPSGLVSQTQRRPRSPITGTGRNGDPSSITSTTRQMKVSISANRERVQYDQSIVNEHSDDDADVDAPTPRPWSSRILEPSQTPIRPFRDSQSRIPSYSKSPNRLETSKRITRIPSHLSATPLMPRLFSSSSTYSGIPEMRDSEVGEEMLLDLEMSFERSPEVISRVQGSVAASGNNLQSSQKLIRKIPPILRKGEGSMHDTRQNQRSSSQLSHTSTSTESSTRAVSASTSDGYHLTELKKQVSNVRTEKEKMEKEITALKEGIARRGWDEVVRLAEREVEDVMAFKGYLTGLRGLIDITL